MLPAGIVAVQQSALVNDRLLHARKQVELRVRRFRRELHRIEGAALVVVHRVAVGTRSVAHSVSMNPRVQLVSLPLGPQPTRYTELPLPRSPISRANVA